jgi:streptogramin lyase
VPNTSPSFVVVPNAVNATSVPLQTEKTGQNQSSQYVPVNITYAYVAQNAGQTLSTKSLRSLSEAYHSLQSSNYAGYTSTAAPISISLDVTPLGGTTTNSTGTCTAGSSGTSGVCTVGLSALPGATTIAATLSEAGTTIAAYSKVVIIRPGISNTFNFTANPVVKSAVAQLGSTSVNAGNAINVPITINAKDANGNIIAGTSTYLDTGGNPVTFSLTVTNNQAGGKGTVTLQGPPQLNAPGQTISYAHYDGNWLANSTISLQSSSNAVTGLTGAVLSTIPTINEYHIPSGNSPYGIASGPDGNIWFTEGNQFIGRLTPAGVFSEFTIPTSNCQPNVITQGPDGNMWFTENNVNNIGRITLNGSIKEFTIPTSGASSSGIVTGPDGNLWFNEVNKGIIGRVTTSGIMTEFPGVFVGEDIANGPDGALWIAGYANIGRITTSGTLTQYPLPAGASNAYGITLGPDGNMWYAELGSNRIGYITTQGVTSDFTIPTAATTPHGIVAGIDGSLWFTEESSSSNNLGKITTQGAITEYPIPTVNTSSREITVGPDGNIWFAEQTGTIGRLIL